VWVWVSGWAGTAQHTSEVRSVVVGVGAQRLSSSVMSGNHRESGCKRVSYVGGEAQWQAGPARARAHTFVISSTMSATSAAVSRVLPWPRIDTTTPTVSAPSAASGAAHERERT
jgi:hypothetical protein